MKRMSQMTYHTGMVLRIYPSNDQKCLIALNSGCQRYVYNHLVAVNNEIYRLSKYKDYVPCCRDRIAYLRTTISHSGIVNSAPFLNSNEVDSLVVANAKKNYNTAWKNMKTRHSGVPVFHKKKYEQSYQTNCLYSSKTGRANIRFLDENHLRLPVLERIRFAGSKKRIWQLLERSDNRSDSFIRIGTVKVSRDACGDYFVSLALASDKPFREYRTEKVSSPVGIDMNLSNFCTMSDSTVIPNPRYRKTLQPRIAKEQRRLSRRGLCAKKDNWKLSESKNYQKSRLHLAKLHRKAARRRADFIGCVTNDIIKNHDVIVVEHLNVRGMLKNRRLASAISDAGWSKFQTVLSQKAASTNRAFVKVPAKNTTQKCSACGYISNGDHRIVLGQDEWIRPACGTHHKRDYNAAVNILQRGLEELAV